MIGGGKDLECLLVHMVIVYRTDVLVKAQKVYCFYSANEVESAVQQFHL
jgi:hypothetical protein